MRTLTSVLAAGLLILAAPLHAQEQDAAGSNDHPIVSRFPGYYILTYDATDFGSFEFLLGDGTEKRVEGKYWQIEYALKEGAKRGGPLEIARNYSNAFTLRGGTKLFEQVEANGGTLSARLPQSGKNIWLQVRIDNGGEAYTLTIVEEAGMAQRVEFSATELATLLNEKGSVALHGILFDTGKATIKPESKAALAPISEVLTSDKSLRLEIQGHTDNVGTSAANLKLSQDRAAAVKAYLVSTFGVAADRLTTSGFGDARPVADNKTDAGRTQNRRVELVKR